MFWRALHGVQFSRLVGNVKREVGREMFTRRRGGAEEKKEKREGE